MVTDLNSGLFEVHVPVSGKGWVWDRGQRILLAVGASSALPWRDRATTTDRLEMPSEGKKERKRWKISLSLL